ncbi:hypothetical protein D3C80_2013480 [compost metagenome]
MLLQSANMPAHRALCDRQFLGGAGEGRMPGGRFEGAQGIEGRQLAGHGFGSTNEAMSLTHGMHRFFPFVAACQTAGECGHDALAAHPCVRTN